MSSGKIHWTTWSAGVAGFAGVAAAVAVQLGGFFVGFVGALWPLPWLLGGLVPAAVAVAVRREALRVWIPLAVGLLLYAATLTLTERYWFGTTERSVVALTWQALGPGSGTDEEVVLTYVRYPAYSEGVLSTELASYLRRAGRDTVEAELELTRDLGCLRGYHLVRVGELTEWAASGGYGARRGVGPAPEPPWGPEPFWCSAPVR